VQRGVLDITEISDRTRVGCSRATVWAIMPPPDLAWLTEVPMVRPLASRITDLTDPSLYDDPWAFYAWLREHDGLWFDERSGLYAVARHADVVAALQAVVRR